ncbi:MAG: FAD-binding oxidoreductase [Pseudomonadota bacterium]
MSDPTVHTSAISPGHSWYEATVGDRPHYPQLNGSKTCDVCIIGGGFTGLSAAVEAAKLGASVIVVDGARFGDGASGRNGGQLNTGQRHWPQEQEEKYGFQRAKALFDLAEEAKAHLLEFTAQHGIDMDYTVGHLSVAHKKRYVDEYREHVDLCADRFGYTEMTFLDRTETEERLGSDRYHCAVYDAGTGHIHPLKLIVGTAQVAASLGASLFENTRVIAIRHKGRKVLIETDMGTITADRVLTAVNAYGDEKLSREMASHVMPIGSFIGATPPLDDLADDVLPGRESVDDSRFVVRYFRRSKQGQMLFGGREIYSGDRPADMEAGIRRQMAEVYPQLRDVPITHAWGGYVGITLPREPFVRELGPGVTGIGGYSGHGVMLSNFTGKMWAEAVCGNRDRLHLFKELNVPAFPGGRTFRKPLLTLALSWYAMLDRL